VGGGGGGGGWGGEGGVLGRGGGGVGEWGGGGGGSFGGGGVGGLVGREWAVSPNVSPLVFRGCYAKCRGPLRTLYLWVVGTVRGKN